MKDRDRQISAMASRVDDFGSSRTADFPPSSLGGQLFASMHQEVVLLEQLGSDQMAGGGAAQTGTGEIRAARNSVRQQMKAITSTSLAMETERPGISNSFRVPRTNGDQALLSAARAFVEAATPLKQEFIKREMAATFLEDLTAAINRFESADNSRNLGKEKRVSATAAIKESLRRVMNLKRQLDPVVRNKYKNDAANLAAWRSASRVESAPQPRRPTPTPPTT